MHIDQLTVEVRDVSLARVGQLRPQDLVGFTGVLRFNNVGNWKLSLPANHRLVDALRAPGAGLIVTGPDGVILSGPTTGAVRTQSRDDLNGTWEISGTDDSLVMYERLAYPTPTTADVSAQTTAYDSRSGQASTVMLEYVNANIGPDAPAARKITGLTLGADPGVGSTVTGSARFDKLGELLTNLAAKDGLGFDIKQNGAALEFTVFEPVDRSGAIRMDIENNQLTKSSYSYTAPGVTRVIVAGQGEGAARTFVEVAAGDTETTWGRRIEQFQDERSTDVLDDLTQAGESILAEKGLTIEAISVSPTDDNTMTYGTDWNLGDMVSVVAGDTTISKIVTEVGILISEDGIRIAATVGDPSAADPESTQADTASDQETRISNLERNEPAAGGGGTVGPDLTGIDTIATLDWAQFDTTYTGGSDEVAKLAWDQSRGTLEFQMLGGNVTAEIGQAQFARVKNSSGSTMTKGQVVYPSGSVGASGALVASLAKATGDSTSAQTFGVVAETIANGDEGYVQTYGILEHLNTSALTEGQVAYLSPTTFGAMTSTKPVGPNHMVYVGFVVRSHATTGIMFIKPQNGYELDELHDVQIGTKADNNLLAWDSASSTWQNQTAAQAGLATTTDLAAKANLSGAAFTGNVTITGTLVADDAYVTTGVATAASGWTVASALFRKRNGIATVNIGLTRSGGTITAGNITNQAVCTLASGYRPIMESPALSGPSGVLTAGYIATTGIVTISAIGTAISTGDNLDINAVFILA
jgi:hypothetical protein